MPSRHFSIGYGRRLLLVVLAGLSVQGSPSAIAETPSGAAHVAPDAAGAATAPIRPAQAGDPTAEPATDHPFAPRPITVPADPAAAAAFAVLDRHCARCHQGGRLKRPAPAAAFGNILRLDEIAASPHLLRPGNPDASRLYVMMLRRLMPLKDHGEEAVALPSADEIAVVRTWISGLSPAPACRDRRPVTTADHVAALTQVSSATSENAARLRFLSIAHLHNGCVRFEALAAYRQAIIRLFNSLSWRPGPVAVPPIDVARTLFKINLDDLGWLPEHWERIMRSGSDPRGLAQPLPPEVRQLFGTAVPVARADWFADTVLGAPLYYDVLGLPGTGPEILKILQIEIASLQQRGGVLRGGVSPSRFALQPSLVERIPGPTGAFWQDYHRFGRDGGSDLSHHADKPGTEAVPYHAARTMFTMPNGLPAFFVVGQRGDRLDAVPPDIARPATSGRAEVRGGLDCLACHAKGPVGVELPSLPKPLAEARATDRKAVEDALQRLGVDPAMTLDGVEPVVALAREFVRPVDALRASAELGIDPAELARIADGPERPATVLARRLVQGLVARAEIDARSRDLIAAVGRPLPEPLADTADAAAARPAGEASFHPIDPSPGLVLYSDKTRYRKGEPLSLVVRVADDCHLTLVSVDKRGRGTVIFPSDFESNTLLTAGQELRLPGAGAPYAFRLNETGRETVVALCNETTAATDNIRHDFERQRFTDLGSYASFLQQNALAASARTETAVDNRRADRAHARTKAKAELPVEPPRPERISRTAITIEIE